MFIKAIAKAVALEAGLSPLQLTCVIARTVATALVSKSIVRELETIFDCNSQLAAMQDLVDQMRREQERRNDEPTDDTDETVSEQ